MGLFVLILVLGLFAWLCWLIFVKTALWVAEPIIEHLEDEMKDSLEDADLELFDDWDEEDDNKK